MRNASSLAASCIVLLVFAAASAWSQSLDELVGQLNSEESGARVGARQLLPRYETNAVPPMLESLQDDDAYVWRAAKNVLADIAHRLGEPGHEDERRVFTQQLLDLATNAEAPAHARKHALRLLTAAAPSEFSLRRVRQLALDATWRAEAVAALEGIETDASREALHDLLEEDDVSLQVAVIEALRKSTPEGEWPIPEDYLRHDNPEIRVAAMRALAGTGHGELVRPFEIALNDLEGRLRVEGMDAYLSLAEALRGTGLADEMYRHILMTETNDVFRKAARTGLQRLKAAERRQKTDGF